MSLGVQLSEQQKSEIAVVRQHLLENPPKPNLQGTCAGCGRGIPVGYLPLVTVWRKEMRGGLPFSVADEIFCQKCAVNVQGQPRFRKTRTVKEEPVVEVGLSVKEIALRLFQACIPRQKYTSTKLAESAKVPYSKLVEQILKKLAEKGKLLFEGGKWQRA